MPHPTSATRDPDWTWRRMKSSTPLHALYLVPCHCLATASYTLWTWSLSTDGSASAIGTPPSSSVASFVSPTAAAVRRLSGHAGHERTFSFFSNTVPSCAVTVALAAFAFAFAAALAAFFASFFAAFLLNTTASPSARASTSSVIAFAITLPVRFAAGVCGKGPHRPTAPTGPTSPNPRGSSTDQEKRRPRGKRASASRRRRSPVAWAGDPGAPSPARGGRGSPSATSPPGPSLVVCTFEESRRYCSLATALSSCLTRGVTMSRRPRTGIRRPRRLRTSRSP